MDSQELQIVRPDIQYQQPFLRYLDAFEAYGETHHSKTAEVARKDFQGFLDILERQAHGVDNEAGFNREQVFWLLHTDGQIIAVARLRYPIIDDLEATQGHLGVTVHPGFRRQGCASYLADFLRHEAIGMGMDHFTLQAAKTNTASRHLITKYGGQFIEEYSDKESGELICRYRIDLKTTTS
jgi:predicted acetyltransferase